MSSISVIGSGNMASAIGALAVVSRVTRQTMVEQQSLEHVEVARSFGLSTRATIWRHVLRNSFGPVLTMCGLIIASMLAGTVVIESVFGLNGVGSLLVGLLNTLGQVMFPELAYFVIFAPMAVLLAFRPLGLFGRAA